MVVYELALHICFLSPLSYERVSDRIGTFIDTALGEKEEYLGLHRSSTFKYYTYDHPYPIEPGRIYRSGRIYTIRLRTVIREMAEYLAAKLSFRTRGGIQSLGGELRCIPQKRIACVYTLTPVVMKAEQGYWRSWLQVYRYEEWLKNNLIRKYNYFTHTEISGDFPLYQKIEFENECPVRIMCKNVVLLGDKLRLTASGNARAQELLYMALGTGLGNNNARGCCFWTCRFR